MPSAKGQARTYASAQLAGWLLIALCNIIVTWIALGLPDGHFGVRALQHGYELAHAGLLGLVSWAAVRLWLRWGPRRVAFGYLALTLVAASLAQLLLRADLRGGAAMLGGGDNAVLPEVLVAAVFSLSVPLCAWFGWRFRSGKIGAGVFFGAVLLATLHQLLWSSLYPGIHSYASWCAELLAAGPLGHWIAIRAASHVPVSSRRLWLTRAGLGACAALAAASVMLPTPQAVRTQMVQVPGSVVAQWSGLPLEVWRELTGLNSLVRLRPLTPLSLQVGTPATSRAQLAWLPDKPIVLLLVIDAMRADVLARDGAKLPTLSALARDGVSFSHVWSPAPATNASVVALFSGRSASQMQWTNKRVRHKIKKYPHADPTPRVAELLDDINVDSGVAAHMPGMKPMFGLTKGFRSTFSAPRAAASVVEAWKRWLPKHSEGACLQYIHFIDAHNPYDLAGTDGSEWENYIAEIGLVDDAIHDMREHLEAEGLTDRTIIIVTADHGDAFGEHNSRFHGSTVYEEQVRVPLIVYHPALAPRRMDNQVSLLDLAPTMLDIFDVGAPATYVGQSLLPALAGNATPRRDPVFIDSQARYVGMVFADWTKLVMHKSGSAALFDLKADPEEKHNIIEQHPEAKARRQTYREYLRRQGLRPFR